MFLCTIVIRACFLNFSIKLCEIHLWATQHTNNHANVFDCFIYTNQVSAYIRINLIRYVNMFIFFNHAKHVINICFLMLLMLKMLMLSQTCEYLIATINYIVFDDFSLPKAFIEVYLYGYLYC